MSIEGQGYFFTIYFPCFDVLCFTRPRNQVSVYRTIGPLVSVSLGIFGIFFLQKCLLSSPLHFIRLLSKSVNLIGCRRGKKGQFS